MADLLTLLIVIFVIVKVCQAIKQARTNALRKKVDRLFERRMYQQVDEWWADLNQGYGRSSHSGSSRSSTYRQDDDWPLRRQNTAEQERKAAEQEQRARQLESEADKLEREASRLHSSAISYSSAESSEARVGNLSASQSMRLRASECSAEASRLEAQASSLRSQAQSLRR